MQKQITNEELIAKLRSLEKGTKEYQDVVLSLFERNKRIARKMAYRTSIIYSHFHELDDLISVAQVGLYRAILNYGFEHKVKFSTFATNCIIHQLNNHVKTEIKNDKLSSLFQPTIQDTNYEGCLVDCIESDVDIEREVILKEERNEKKNILKILKNGLTKKQADLIEMRYFKSDHVVTFEKLAEKANCSHQGMSSLEKKAIAKMQENYKLYLEAGLDLSHIDKILSLRGELKNIIETKLVLKQRQILLAMYYSPVHLKYKELSANYGISMGGITTIRNDGVAKLTKFYNQTEPQNKFSDKQILGILNIRELEQE